MKLSTKILIVGIICLGANFNFVYAQDSAFIPGGYWEQLLRSGGLFGGNINLFGGTSQVERLTNVNCRYEERPNPYTGQTTYDYICDPKIVKGISTPNSGSTSYGYNYGNYGSYSVPTSYVQPVAQQYYYNNSSVYSPVNSAMYYTTPSNIWYPQNNFGYSNETMFNTYYRGGPGDYTGYYQPVCYADGYCQQSDTRGNYAQEDEYVMYGVSNNEEDYYQQALKYGRANGLSDDEINYYYNSGYNSYVPGENEYEIVYEY